MISLYYENTLTIFKKFETSVAEKDLEYAFLFKELNALMGVFSLDGSLLF